VIVYVLGAPGSGKSATAGPLRALLPGWVVFDWDGLMSAAGTLAGGDISSTPITWGAYGLLVRAVVEEIASVNLVLLDVCTPDDLDGWPAGRWVLLDCTDDERRARLTPRADTKQVEHAVNDASAYRRLGLPAADSTGITPAQVAVQLAGMMGRPTE
jgi:hypothetical protein